MKKKFKVKPLILPDKDRKTLIGRINLVAVAGSKCNCGCSCWN